MNNGNERNLLLWFWKNKPTTITKICSVRLAKKKTFIKISSYVFHLGNLGRWLNATYSRADSLSYLPSWSSGLSSWAKTAATSRDTNSPTIFILQNKASVEWSLSRITVDIYLFSQQLCCIALYVMKDMCAWLTQTGIKNMSLYFLESGLNTWNVRAGSLEITLCLTKDQR